MAYKLIEVVQIMGTVLTILVFARVILSWVNVGHDHAVVQWIYRLSEPLLRPVRSILPAMGGLDFSPIIVLFGIQIAEQVLIKLLINIGSG